MVDVRVGMIEAPFVRISGEPGAHVGIDEGLQVEPEGVAIGADNHIGARALRARYVAVRKGQLRIG
jgi:hypothetical protein